MLLLLLLVIAFITINFSVTINFAIYTDITLSCYFRGNLAISPFHVKHAKYLCSKQLENIAIKSNRNLSN